jgi:transposase InsO family protein
VRFELIDAEKAKYPLAILCAALDVSRSGYYAWKGRPASARAQADERLGVEIVAIHHRSRRTYGSPRVHADLRAKGRRVGKKRVARLMSEKGIAAQRKRRFRRTTDSNHDGPIAPNLLERNFVQGAPNKVWVTDVTYIFTAEGWLYLAAMLDLYSRRVVGWATSDTNDRFLALDALYQALRARRPRAGLMHHSDRGSPYASEDYRNALRDRGITASMSRTGDCWDNAVAESFFASLKGELVDHERYATRAAAVASIGDYIERFYNTERRHSHLGYVSPIEFELRSQTAAIAA